MDNGEIKIDKGVPLPAKIHHRDGIIPTLRVLEINDSFFMRQRNGLQTYLYKASGMAGIRISTRTVTENGIKGVRVWRIA